MVPLPAVKRRPIVMAASGPAAGVSASVRTAQELHLPRVLTFDMGGTTTDVCLIVDGIAEMTDTRMINDRPLRQPMLAVHSIGAGGGSIVQLGPGGLTVGPASAGSEPGPACYGRGGTRPTITDANAVLGLLDPDARLGERIGIDVDLAAAAIAPIADGLGLGLTETALGIIRVANATMARALRRVTVERGIDGRDCTLLAFGGGGPMHAAGLASLYGMRQAVVPMASSAFSALGCLTADFSFLQQQTVRFPLQDFPRAIYDARIADLVRQATDPLLANGVDPQGIRIEHVALMRYAAQSDATAVPYTAPLDVAALQRAFHDRHRQLYGYATAEPCVIEALRVQARKPSTIRSIRPRPSDSRRPDKTRLCTFDAGGAIPTRILDRETLGGEIVGPAIIVDAWSTIVVPPRWHARPDEAGNIFLDNPA